MPLSKESIGVLEQLKSKGTPCNYVMLTRASKVTSLVAYRKGSQDTRVNEAKKIGTGTISCGVADGQGANLSFKLLRSDGYETAPIRASILKDYLAENGNIKVSPTIDIVDVLPPVADEDAQAASFSFRSGDEWKNSLAAIQALNDPQARATAIADAVRDYGAEHLKLQKHLAANPQWPQAQEAQETLNRVLPILKQLQASKPATPQPAAVVPQLQPRQPTASAATAAQPPVRTQTSTPVRQPAAQPAVAAPPQAATPARPVRPNTVAPTYDSAANTVGKEISGQLQSIFGSAERQKMLADCQADAKSDFGKVVGALPAGGLSYEQTVAGYQNAKLLAEKYIKSHGKPLFGKTPDKVQKAKDHCLNVIASIDKQLETMRKQNEAALEMAQTYQGLVKRKRAVPPGAANELQRLADQPLISQATRNKLNDACMAIYDSNWAGLGAEGDAVQRRAKHAGDILSMQAKASGKPEDATKAGDAKLIGEAISRVDGLIRRKLYREAIDITSEAVRRAKDMDGNVANALANGTPDIQQWQKLNVRDRLRQIIDTDNLDGAADPAVGNAFRKAVKEMESGNFQAAIATAQPVIADFEAALGKYEAARQACAAYGDIKTVSKKGSETAYGISVALKTSDPETAKRAETFANSGFSNALQTLQDGQFIRAEKAIQDALGQLAEIKKVWSQQRGPVVKQEFDQRAQNAAGAAEQEIAARIGEQTYLEMLDLAESIAKSYGFDLSGMNKDEIATVFGYTTEDFNKINPLLRDMKPAKLDDQQWAKLKVDFDQYNRSLIEGMKKLPGFSGDVVRGTTLPDSLLRKIKSEQKFSDTAFLSTSCMNGFAGPHQILIRAKGRNGKDVSNFSMYKKTEKEILFLPGTEFRLVQMVDYPETKPHPLLHAVGDLFIELEEI